MYGNVAKKKGNPLFQHQYAVMGIVFATSFLIIRIIQFL